MQNNVDTQTPWTLQRVVDQSSQITNQLKSAAGAVLLGRRPF